MALSYLPSVAYALGDIVVYVTEALLADAVSKAGVFMLHGQLRYHGNGCPGSAKIADARRASESVPEYLATPPQLNRGARCCAGRGGAREEGGHARDRGPRGDHPAPRPRVVRRPAERKVISIVISG